MNRFMKTKLKRVVWHTIILRRDRDAEKLSDGLETGDHTSQIFCGGLATWILRMRDAAKDEAPSCLTCERTFHGKPPATFMMAFSKDPQVKHVIIIGVCNHCAAEKTEAELLSHASEGISHYLGDRWTDVHG